jgi:very-short-patch-repair endonuclease
VAEKLRAERQIFSTHPDRVAGEVAARQHGVIARGQLAKAGIDDSGIRRRVAQGRLHRVHAGVYLVGPPRLTEEGRWMAAVLACGRGAALGQFDASSLWEFYKAKGPRVHVIARWDLRVPGVCVHRARRLHPDDVTTKNGIPVTTVARTLVDLTDLLPEDRVLRAIREAEYRQLLDLTALNAAVKRARGRPHTEKLKRALAIHTPGQIVRSELEHRFLQLVKEAGLPAPATNVQLEARGRHYEVDCLWREAGVVVELDGRAAHARTAAFEEDRSRDAALSAIGLRSLRFTWERVTHGGGEVIAELSATLARSAA